MRQQHEHERQRECSPLPPPLPALVSRAGENGGGVDRLCAGQGDQAVLVERDVAAARQHGKDTIVHPIGWEVIAVESKEGDGGGANLGAGRDEGVQVRLNTQPGLSTTSHSKVHAYDAPSTGQAATAAARI